MNKYIKFLHYKSHCVLMSEYIYKRIFTTDYGVYCFLRRLGNLLKKARYSMLYFLTSNNKMPQLEGISSSLTLLARQNAMASEKIRTNE